eukprot:2303619-Alexandrium_andersonii.AAC.1
MLPFVGRVSAVRRGVPERAACYRAVVGHTTDHCTVLWRGGADRHCQDCRRRSGAVIDCPGPGLCCESA